MSKIGGVLIFAAGFAGGSLCARFLLKKKYEILKAEEIKSIKDSYKRETQIFVEKALKEHGIESSEDIATVLGVINDDVKVRETRGDEKAPEEKDFSKEEPYIISPTDFNEIYGYETATLTLYSDGIVADEDMEVVDDPEEILGEANLEELRDGEADCIYIRNDAKYSDYEVLRDYGTFEDALYNQN